MKPDISQQEIQELTDAVAEFFMEMEGKDHHLEAKTYQRAVKLLNLAIYRMNIEPNIESKENPEVA